MSTKIEFRHICVITDSRNEVLLCKKARPDSSWFF